MKGLQHLLQVELFICHVIFISYECWSYFKQLPFPIDYSITLLVSEHVAIFLLLSHKSYSFRGVSSLGSYRRVGYGVIWSTQEPVCDNNTHTALFKCGGADPEQHLEVQLGQAGTLAGPCWCKAPLCWAQPSLWAHCKVNLIKVLASRSQIS